ncbi:hypothetical protein QQ045_009797 [Rhodiola kirilowii]
MYKKPEKIMSRKRLKKFMVGSTIPPAFSLNSRGSLNSRSLQTLSPFAYFEICTPHPVPVPAIMNNRNRQQDAPPLLPLPPQPPLPDPCQQPADHQAGGRGHRRNDDPQIRPPRIPNLQRPVEAPRPRHLATVGTPERNDPLWTTGLAGVELRPMPNVEYIYPGAEALPQVINVIHATCTSASTSYNLRVPECALAYYCAVATYTRMLRLQAANSLPVTTDEERFVEQVDSLQLEVPLLLAHYLAGFGNTRVPSGRNIRFRMLARPEYVSTDNVSGWFGRVSQQTQALYQNYPCLAVFASRLLAEVDEQADRRWTLPLEVVPAEGGGLGASPSLLGYTVKRPVPRGHVGFLEETGIAPDEPFETSNSSLPLNISLLIAVQNELSTIQNFKLSPMPTIQLGSQAQLGLITIEDELTPIADKPAVLECTYEMPNEISFSASAFCYRVNHALDKIDEGNLVTPWVVWRFHPGPEWVRFALEGNAFRGREPDVLAITEFRTTPYLVRARLKALERALQPP